MNEHVERGGGHQAEKLAAEVRFGRAEPVGECGERGECGETGCVAAVGDFSAMPGETERTTGGGCCFVGCWVGCG